MKLDEYRKMYELEESFWWYRGMWKITEKVLRAQYGERASISILDAGCGTGKMLETLRQFTLNVPVGFDFSAEAMKFLKKRAEPYVFQASTTQIPLPAETFDLVTSFDVLCQLGKGGDVEALEEFYRVLKPKGKIYVRLPAYQWLYASHDKASLTLHRYTCSELIAKVEGAQFKIMKVSYANFFLFPLFATKRLIVERLGLLADSSDLRPVPSLLNRLLELPLQWESLLLKKSLRFPWGVSLICLAEKP